MKKQKKLNETDWLKLIFWFLFGYAIGKTFF